MGTERNVFIPFRVHPRMLNVRYGLKANSSLTIGMGGSGHYPIDSRQCHGAVAALILDAVLGRERFGAQSAPNSAHLISGSQFRWHQLQMHNCCASSHQQFSHC